MSVVDRPLLNTDLDAVFDPRSVAIYGISERTSLRIAENMTPILNLARPIINSGGRYSEC